VAAGAVAGACAPATSASESTVPESRDILIGHAMEVIDTLPPEDELKDDSDKSARSNAVLPARYLSLSAANTRSCEMKPGYRKTCASALLLIGLLFRCCGYD